MDVGAAVARVFVSFATPDLPIAREVVGWLRADGHEAFLDRDAASGIPAGEQWRQRLYGELRRVDAVISVVTAASARSNWCSAELGIADAMGCLVIPLRAESDVDQPLLEHRQYADYVTDRPGARTRVLQALRWLDGGFTGRQWRDGHNRFPGLEPFTSATAAVFFGRAAENRELARSFSTCRYSASCTTISALASWKRRRPPAWSACRWRLVFRAHSAPAVRFCGPSPPQRAARRRP